MLQKDSVTQYFAACRYNLGSSVAGLLGVNSEAFHFMSSEYILKSKAGLVFVEKHESEDRL